MLLLVAVKLCSDGQAGEGDKIIYPFVTTFNRDSELGPLFVPSPPPTLSVHVVRQSGYFKNICNVQVMSSNYVCRFFEWLNFLVLF